MCPAFLQFWCNVIHCKSAYKNGHTVICVPCMFEHVCYEPFLLSEIHVSKTRFKQINENLTLNVYARMFWEPVYKISYP